MSAVPPLPEDLAARHALLTRAEAFIVRMIDLALRFLNGAPADGLAPALCRRLLLHVIAPAEAAFRRALVIIAVTLPPPAPRAPRAGPPPPPPGEADRAAAEPRAPLFRLTEPPLRPPADDRAAGQRLTVTGAAVSPRPAPAPAALTARLVARLGALIAAVEDPARTCRRFLRRRRRAPARACLRLAPAPRLAAREHPPADLALLHELNTQAARDYPDTG